MTWFDRRTFHHDRFADLGALRRAKEEQGLTVSVCIPARNEEATIGGVVEVVRRELMEAEPLVDQIAVMDAASEDATARMAKNAGADVFQESDVLPELEHIGGKGDALWKSLFVLGGDLVAWVDADVVDFHPRFVSGLLGPLLTDPEIGFVKAFYERPIARADGSIDPTGGGRVTELVARPLLNMFWPNLANVIQPLSGEYAGRRAILEAVPFFTGYAVEIGLLIDIAETFGMDAIAQVDLDTRTHRNRGIDELSPMAFAIMQAAVRRLESSGRMSLDSPIHTLLHRAEKRDGRSRMVESRVEVAERPPAVSVAGYPR